MKQLGSASMPIPIVVRSSRRSWRWPSSGSRRRSGSCCSALVVLAGVVLLARGSRAAGVVVVVMPFAVFLFVTEVVGELLFKPYRVPSESMLPTIRRRRPRPRRPQRPLAAASATSSSPTPRWARSTAAAVRRPPGSPRALARRPGCRTSSSSSAWSPGRATPSPSATASSSATATPSASPTRGAAPRTSARCPRPSRCPTGAWFLAGDFRGESDDSRFWGPVPTKAITGHRQVPLLAAEQARDGSEASPCAGRRREVGSRAVTTIGGRHGRRGPRRLRRRREDHSRRDPSATSPRARRRRRRAPSATSLRARRRPRPEPRRDFGEGQEKSSD